MASTLTGSYRVAEGDVRLLITIGNEQLGWSTVMLGPRLVAEGRHIDADLGPGLELRGRVLLVTTEVREVQPGTDQVSVTWILKGGREPKMWHLSEQMAEGGLFTSHAVFTFAE
jgi:hypothetical protein